MGTGPVPLDRPPMQPPSVQPAAGGGTNPMTQVAQMIAARQQQNGGQAPPAQGAPQTPGVNPQGALLAQGEAVQKVIKQMASMSEPFAPFAARILDILNTGMATAAGTPASGAAQSPAGDSPATGDSMSAKPTDGVAGKGFPG